MNGISYSLKNAKNKQTGPMSQHKIKTNSNYSSLVHFAKEKKGYSSRKERIYCY